MTKENLQLLLTPGAIIDKDSLSVSENKELRSIFASLGIFGNDCSRAYSAYNYRLFRGGFKLYEIEGITAMIAAFADEQGLTGKIHADLDMWKLLSDSEREAFISFAGEYGMGQHMVTGRIPQMRFDEWELRGLKDMFRPWVGDQPAYIRKKKEDGTEQ